MNQIFPDSHFDGPALVLALEVDGQDHFLGSGHEYTGFNHFTLLECPSDIGGVWIAFHIECKCNRLSCSDIVTVKEIWNSHCRHHFDDFGFSRTFGIICDDAETILGVIFETGDRVVSNAAFQGNFASGRFVILGPPSQSI